MIIVRLTSQYVPEGDGLLNVKVTAAVAGSMSIVKELPLLQLTVTALPDTVGEECLTP